MRKIANEQLRRRRHQLRHNKDDVVLKHLVDKCEDLKENVNDYIRIRRALGNKSPEEFAKFAKWNDTTASVINVYKFSRHWASERGKFLACRMTQVRKIFLP